MFTIHRLLPYQPIHLPSLNRLLNQQSPGKSVADMTDQELAFSTSSAHFHAYVALDSESRVCLGLATMFFQCNIVRWIAELHDVVVDETQRGKGIGEQLVRHTLSVALEFSRTNDIKIKLYLTSRPSRVAANALYKKLGFTLVSQADGAWGTNLYKIIVEPEGLRGLT